MNDRPYEFFQTENVIIVSWWQLTGNRAGLATGHGPSFQCASVYDIVFLLMLYVVLFPSEEICIADTLDANFCS